MVDLVSRNQLQSKNVKNGVHKRTVLNTKGFSAISLWMRKGLECSESSAPSDKQKKKVPNVMSVNLTNPPETCGRNKYVTFLPNSEQTSHPVTHFLRQNAFTANTRPSLLYTRQCLRKESFCVLGLFFVFVLCCTSSPLSQLHTHMYTYTSATEPLFFFLITSF